MWGLLQGKGQPRGWGSLKKKMEGSTLVTFLCHLLQMGPSEMEKKTLYQKRATCLPRERTLHKNPQGPASILLP